MTLRLLLLIALSGTMLAACQPLHEPDPTAEELLLPLSQLPATWEVSGSPRPMGPHIGFGDEDDYYISFKLKSSKYIISDHFVLSYPSVRKAEAGYLKLFPAQFNDYSIAVNKPWETPAELSFTSTYANQFHMACTINNVAGEKQVCEVMAQYGKYISIFYAEIRTDTMSLSDFNSIARFLDEMMVQYNGLAN